MYTLGVKHAQIRFLLPYNLWYILCMQKKKLTDYVWFCWNLKENCTEKLMSEIEIHHHVKKCIDFKFIQRIAYFGSNAPQATRYPHSKKMFGGTKHQFNIVVFVTSLAFINLRSVSLIQLFEESWCEVLPVSCSMGAILCRTLCISRWKKSRYMWWWSLSLFFEETHAWGIICTT